MRKTLTTLTVLTFLKTHGATTPAELALAFGWGKKGLPKIRTIFQSLHETGEIEWEGSTSDGGK